MDDIPRRNKLWQNTPEELAIRDMVGRIERLGADPLLTDCVVLLAAAKDKLGDWVDAQLQKPDTTCPRCYGVGHYYTQLFDKMHCGLCNGTGKIK